MISKRQQQGFTLTELMLAVVILGVLMVVISPMVSNAFLFTEAAGRKEIMVDNQKLAQAMVRYASTTDKGKLPDPPGSRNWGLIDSGSPEELERELQGSGVSPTAFNTSGTGINHVKIYRRIEDLESEIPLYFTTGTRVKLKYDVGVIYQTTCPEKSPCAGNSLPGGAGSVVVTGASGSTANFTEDNLSGWEPKGEDFGAVMFNTLDIQKDRLRITLGRINRLSDRISSYYYAKARADTRAINHFPGDYVDVSDPDDPGDPFDSGPKDPYTNEGCKVGWVNLKGSQVLQALALNEDEFGVTAWGGAIQYCRDYGYESTPDGGPFFSALRFNRELTEGKSPAATDNVVITF